MSKLITVFGATGNQGGSVIKHILADSTLSKTFKIRGITRDTSKPGAQALAKQGVEMKSADLSDKASVTKALQGSDTVFLVTNYWESAKYEVEFDQGKNVADASKELGVQHLIFSSLLHVGKITNGRLSHVPHFEAKSDIEDYIKKIGVPASFFLPGYFMSNFTQSVQKGEDGSLSFAFPVSKDAKFPLIDIAEDTGKFVNGILKNRDETLNKHILGAENYYTPEQIRSSLEAATGKKTHFAQITAEQYKGFLPGFIAEEMLENHQFIDEPGYYNGAELKESHDIVDDKLVSWEEFIKKSGAF
ncbi:NmrA family transcriptional regulator [Didymella exigua CBS 183.55]|uniref:NmrA-like family domain-containing protein 1 n=1 Tax=Didymella exigua CBS 183.55 TaxID=1150837 RepID=A0A6A5RZ67_9PLEO|nr:NmrA family transcriptional regulator [Didymella exigua CBS 183.55]KAF1930547.1 NmrA family transcriptional regulator [Didymella exigua CBS 183.55]